MKRKCLLGLSLAGWMMLIGCNDSQFYRMEDVQEVSLKKSDQRRILQYRVPMETAFHSPGVRLTERENQTLIQIVRCPINEECPTDLPSILSEGVSQIGLPLLPEKNLYLSDGKNQVKIR